MRDLRKECGELVAEALYGLVLLDEQLKSTIHHDDLTALILIETPPNSEMGDVGVPLFAFAKLLRRSPVMLSGHVVEFCKKNLTQKVSLIGNIQSVGPYVNFFLDKTVVSTQVLQNIYEQDENYGFFATNNTDCLAKPFAGRRIMIEFSSPNTNKPLHLGHLRNDALGESCSRILQSLGADVYKVNIINDRGVHICKSMLAYERFHSAEAKKMQGLSPVADTPELLGIKSDRFVGDCYVEFNDYAKEFPNAEQEAQNLLVEWEKGNKTVRTLWRTMNDWAISGVKQTYMRTGITFDKFYFESETYLLGKDEILKGLDLGLFYKETDGSVWVDLSEIKLDKKVLLRKDGTALYMTQDIGTAIHRSHDWKFDQLVYVVGSEQVYHFKVLFYVLQKLGFNWAKNLYHLSYGMVNLPEGKMKSREGTVVDADDLIDELRDGARDEICAKGREDAVENLDATAEAIALSALHYFLLQNTPTKDMIFNPKESLAFNGNTGPYLQYMGARIASILRKSEQEGFNIDFSTDISQDSYKVVDQHSLFSSLKADPEWALIKLLQQFPQVVQKAGTNFDPSLIASYLYETAKAFSQFYHECPILSQKDVNLKKARLLLAKCTQIVLKNGMNLILVPFLEKM